MGRESSPSRDPAPTHVAAAHLPACRREPIRPLATNGLAAWPSCPPGEAIDAPIPPLAAALHAPVPASGTARRRIAWPAHRGARAGPAPRPLGRWCPDALRPNGPLHPPNGPSTVAGALLYSLCIISMRSSPGGPVTTPLQARPVPDIVTELPGPRARAHIEFDHAWTSPSLPRAYPIVPVRGLGCAVEDIDGNVFLDFAAGIAVNSTGHSHPDVVAAIKRQAEELQHFSRERLLPADLRPGRRGARPHRPDDGRQAHLHRQLRRGGGRGGPQARPVPHAPPERDRVPRRLPRPDDGRRQPHRVEGEVPRALRPAAPRRLPRALRQRGRRGDREARLQAPDARRRVRRRHRGAHPGRGRLRRPRGRLPARACASCATATGSCSSPTRSSRARGAPARCGRSSTGTWSRTSCSRPRASAPACRSARWSPAPRS